VGSEAARHHDAHPGAARRDVEAGIGHSVGGGENRHPGEPVGATHVREDRTVAQHLIFHHANRHVPARGRRDRPPNGLLKTLAKRFSEGVEPTPATEDDADAGDVHRCALARRSTSAALPPPNASDVETA
jgi:hypothetical protein